MRLGSTGASRPTAGAPIGAVAETALRVGRLLLMNGADTGHVHRRVAEIAKACGYSARLAVNAETLIVTLEGGGDFRTKIGSTLQSVAVDMRALRALEALVRDIRDRGLVEAEVSARLDAVEAGGSFYPEALVLAGIGVTAASFARLFGAEGPVLLAAFLAGLVSAGVRRMLRRRRVNAVGGAFVAAFTSGLAAALVMRAFPGVSSPAIGLVAVGMTLTPGVPIINGMRDMLVNRVGSGLAGLSFGAIILLVAGLGVFLAAAAAGVPLPAQIGAAMLPPGEDAVFAAWAAVGFALFFNVPPQALWACALCGAASHGLRTVLQLEGLDLAAGSFVGALVAGGLARLFGRIFDSPPVTFAFPGVVAMMPSLYALRAAIGGLWILRDGSLVEHTAALAVTTLVTTAAIAVGVSIALALPFGSGLHRLGRRIATKR